MSFTKRHPSPRITPSTKMEKWWMRSWQGPLTSCFMLAKFGSRLRALERAAQCVPKRNNTTAKTYHCKCCGFWHLRTVVYLPRSKL